MASRLRRAALAVVAASLLSAPSPALAAEPTLSDRETARSLMEDGDGRRDKNDLKGALKSYEAADAIMHVPTTGLEVGRTLAMLGMLLEARETLNRVAKLPAKPGDPAPFEKARRAAEQLSADVGARIPSITVNVTGAEPGQTPQIVFDGEIVPTAAAFAPRKVNPGAHTIVVRGNGTERKEDVTVAEREQKTVTVDLAVPAKPPPAAVAAAPASASAPPGSQPATDRASGGGGASPGKLLVYGGFAVGAIGVGVGAVTGIMSVSEVSDIKKSCVDNHCPSNKQGDIDSAKTLGTVSTIAFIAGGAGIAVGVVGLVLSGKSDAEPADRAAATSAPTSGPRLHADVGPAWLGVSGVF